MPQAGAIRYLDRLGEPFLFLEEREVVVTAGQPHVVINHLPKAVIVLEGNLQHRSPEGLVEPLRPGGVLLNGEKRRNIYLPPAGKRSGRIRVLRLTWPWKISRLPAPPARAARRSHDELQPEPDTLSAWLADRLPRYGVFRLPDVSAHFIQELRACLSSRDAGRRHRANTLARLVLLDLIPQAAPATESAFTSTRLLGNLEQFLETHLHESLTLAQIARAADRSEEHIARFFRRQRGVTLFDELRRLRIKRAEYLLLCSEIGIQRIAEQTGFTTLAHFSRTFRQATGVSPSEYRRHAGFRTVKI